MKKITLLLMVLAILLVGCPKSQSFAATNFKTGSSAIDARFIQSSPSSIVFSDSPFEIALELNNKGAYNVVADQGAINLVTDEGVQLLEGSSQTFSAEGRSQNNPDGEIVVKTFQVKASKLTTVEQQASTIQAQLCYPYETELSVDVCIDTDIENKLTKKPCKLTNPSLSGQGSPIAVTQVQTELIPSAGKLVPRFTLTIANKGSGQVIQEDLVQTLCQGGAGQRFLPIIRVEDALISDRRLNCRPTDLNLKSNVDNKIICSYDQGFPLSLTPFTTPLIVRLRYGYFQAVSKTITIKK